MIYHHKKKNSVPLFFAGNKKKDGALVLISVVICVIINIGLVNAKIEILQNAGGAFTLPFVLATCLVLPLKNYISRNDFFAKLED